MGNRIRSLTVENYLGAARPVKLEFGDSNTLLIGPNNSGKSVLCGALQLFKNLTKDPLGSFEQGNTIRTSARSDGNISVDLFHKGCEKANVTVVFDVDCDIEKEFAATFRACGIVVGKRTDVQVDIQLFSNGSKQLVSLKVGGTALYLREENTAQLRYVNSAHHPQNPILAKRIFDLPTEISRSIVCFSAKRYLEVTGGDADDVDALASGESLASWIQKANNPAPQRADDRERHALLKSFEREFAKFIGADHLNINVSNAGISLTVDDELMPISRLGTGIGECLTILLVCKIAGQSKLLHGMNICVLEEPELFLHPKLQRQLIDLVQSYGVQLVVTTHSPTVLDFAWRAGWKIFSTTFNRAAQRIEAELLPRTGIGAVLADIGVRPSDWLQAEGVVFVEGPTDVPVFKKWLTLVPNHAGRNISVIPIGGRMTANDNFDFAELNKLGRTVAVIMDSERAAEGAPMETSRAKIQKKCADVGIPCLLTERRATENYFSAGALAAVYGEGKSIGSFAKPNVDIPQFTKQRNDEVAARMVWTEIESTDVGRALHEFVGRLG
jgi:hypothetical protein